MTYEKQTWVDGVTPLDAEHLNHMENGIAATAEEAQNNKFPTEAKTVLIDILRNAVFNTDISEKINNLLTALGLEVEPEIEEVSITPVNGSVNAATSNTGAGVGNFGNYQRVSLLTKNAEKPLYDSYGLIKIPENATSLHVDALPGLSMGYFIFAFDGKNFVAKIDSGWIEMSEDHADVEIDQTYADGAHYFAVNFKKTISGLFADEDYNADNFKVHFVLDR